MFFNDDILYRNGALAIVWLAGNEMFKNKSKRSKGFQSVLKSNVIRICVDLRGLFPRMGTTHGIPLIKMGVLAKGVGQIYCLKMNNFARDVLDALANLNKPVISSDSRISMPPPKSKSKSKTATTEGDDEIELPGPNETVFGEIPGHFEGDNVVQEFGTPRALPSPPSRDSLELSGPIPPFRMQTTPPRDHITEVEGVPGSRKKTSKRTAPLKRRREEDSEEAMYEDVIRKLQSAAADPRAHCLIEDVPLINQEPYSEGGFGDTGGFGDGMDLLQMQGVEDDGGMPLADPVIEPDMEIPLAPPSTSVGPPSSLEIDTRSRAMETPERGTRPTNNRARRGENANEDSLELADISGETRGRGRVARVRRRLRLKIDAETNISLKEMLAQVNAQASETNFHSLREKLAQSLAPPKSLWSMIPKTKNVMDLIRSSGRTLPSVALTEMKSEIMEQQLQRPERSELVTHSNATLEEQRDRTGHTTGAGISSHSIVPSVQGSSIGMPPIELEPIDDMQPVLEQAEPLAPADDMAVDQNVFEEGGEGLGAGMVTSDDDRVPPPLLEEPQGPPAKRTRESVVEETSKLARLTGEQTFSKLYPPQQVSRRHAALAFFTLLKMQSKKEVNLVQEEPFADIIIESHLKQ